MITIQGTVSFQSLEGGFWSISDDKTGLEYTLIDAPIDLQNQGLRVKIKGIPDEEGMSVFMFGTPLKVVSFSIIEKT